MQQKENKMNLEQTNSRKAKGHLASNPNNLIAIEVLESAASKEPAISRVNFTAEEMQASFLNGFEAGYEKARKEYQDE